jgi:hypothetical protein
MSETKKEYKLPEGHVGYISKSKAGNSMITVEQDITLKKGDKLSIRKPQDEIDARLERGFITEEQAEKYKSYVPEWKLSEVKVMKFTDNK